MNTQLKSTNAEISTRSRKLLYIRRLFLCVSLLAVICSGAAFISPQAFASTLKPIRSPHSFPNVQHKKHLGSPQVRPLANTSTIFPSWNFLGCGTGWNPATDTYLHYFKYAYTTGSQSCSSAVWDDSSLSLKHTCDVIVYIPTIFATANIAYGLYLADGSVKRVTINQNSVYGWNYLTTVQKIKYVLISSNNGQNGAYMAAGEMGFTCY